MYYGHRGLGTPKLYVTPIEGGDIGVFQSVGTADTLVAEGSRDSAVRAKAEQIIRDAGVRENDELGVMKAIVDWTKTHLHYLPDPNGTELFKTPSRSLAEIEEVGVLMGDCDDATILVLALLKSVGFPVKTTIISSSGNIRGNFNHIFGGAYSKQAGKWVAIDITAKGRPFGWSPTGWRRRDSYAY